MKKYVYLYLLITLTYSAVCQEQSERALSLKDALQLAEQQYPLLKSKQLEVKAAGQNVSAAKRTLLPSLDASYQVNFATYNNITGMAYSQTLVPISGPPSAENVMDGVFGTATGLLLNWQPITFGQRSAQIDFAKRELQTGSADAANELFQHKVKVINAYLDWLTAIELQKVYEENLQRTETNLRLINSLVNSGIRPGVDTAVFKAEVSKAKVDVFNSKKRQEQIRIYFTQLLATDDIAQPADTTFFEKLPTAFDPNDMQLHPLLELYRSTIEQSEARKKVLSKTIMPTLGVWGAAFARGSGIDYTGVVNSNAGLELQRFNYGIGLQLSMPLLQSVKIRPQVVQQNFLIQANQERMSEVELQLKKQNEEADTALKNAFAIADETPLLLQSAQFSFESMQSRYQSGLTNISDLLQAQYTLVKAEADTKIAFVAVWKAFLFKTAVNGNLNTFLNQVN
ncbi:MAG: TolC family protein [Tannerella sp.]|jgi:outer membrane protein TolC|nr:TolC family protein [Tannerella sp.]